MKDLTLVTGSTGLVGNNVVRLLLERGQSVRVLVRKSSSARPLSDLDVEIVHGDTRDSSEVREAVRGVGLVIHCAALVQIGRTGLDYFRSINVEGTRHVAAAAREEAIRLVHVSSTDALGVGSPDAPADEETSFDTSIHTPYLLSKYEAEAMIQDAVSRGLEAVIVNPSVMLGPWDWKPSSGRMLVEVAQGRGWFAPRGHFSLVDVRDVAEGILAAVEKGAAGRRYILAGQSMSYLDGWRLFAEVAGARHPWGQVGPIASAIAGWSGDCWGWTTGKEPVVNSGALKIANLPRSYSSARAQQELGFRNRPLCQTVEDALGWFMRHGYLPG